MFKQTDIWTLIDKAPSLGVSIFLPTHICGAGICQDPIRLKALVAEARGKLDDAGMSPDQVEALLAPASALVEDNAFWQHRQQGQAFFLGTEVPLFHHLPVSMPECVVVGPCFHIRPLLTIFAAEDAFLLLTITADRVRLFEASRFGLREDLEVDLPRSLVEANGEDTAYEVPERAVPAIRTQVAVNGITPAYVQGESGEAWRKRRLIAFYDRIAADMDACMAGDLRPVVIAADAQAQRQFRRASKLGPLLAGVVEVNPEALDRDVLHTAALGVLQPRFEARKRRAAERLEAYFGGEDDRETLELLAILDAARIGRISTLLLAQGASLPNDGGLVDDGWDENLPQASADRTLRHGGDVTLLPNMQILDGVRAAALFRY